MTAEASAKNQILILFMVEPDPGSTTQDRVNVRVPIKLIQAGMKFASLLPKDIQGKVDNALKESGISLDLSEINEENLKEIIESLRDLTVDVEGRERVRVFFGAAKWDGPYRVQA